MFISVIYMKFHRIKTFRRLFIIHCRCHLYSRFQFLLINIKTITILVLKMTRIDLPHDPQSYIYQVRKYMSKKAFRFV